MDFRKLNDRYQETKQYKDRWLALYKELYYYVIPDRDAFNVKWNYDDQGKPNTQQVWDNTAVLAAYQRANDLHGLLLPQDRIWGKFALDPHIFSDDQINAMKPDMDEMNDRIFFYLNQSNLARVVSGSNLDLVGGTAALWVESVDDYTPLYFRSIPAVALYVEYSTDDVLNTCWYQCKMTGRMILDSFPDYEGTQRNALIEAPNDKFIVIYGQIKMAENKFFIYATLEDDPFYPLFETERTYNQIIVYRDRVRPGESDGRGIGVDMLPTIKDLNTIVMQDRQSLAFKANPPMFYDSNAYFNPYSVRQWSGAMIARNPQGRSPLEALKMPEYASILEEIRDLREVIRDGFQVDPLGEVTQSVKSATEVSIRENRAQRTSATDISRLVNELPKQVYEVAAKILSERRLLDRKRSKSFNPLAMRNFRFDYQSPLYDLQKQDDLSHFVTNMQIKQQFFGQQAAMATVNVPEVSDFLTDTLNLKYKLFKSRAEMLQLMDAVKQNTQQLAAQGAPLPAPSTSAIQTPPINPSQVQV